jgi:hypothetical protein
MGEQLAPSVPIGAKVRFRRLSSHWTEGVLTRGPAKDGSLTIFDAKGRMRAIAPDCIEVATRGPRGGSVWTPLPDITDPAAVITVAQED